MELNQGHMDFQSIALPPELRHPLLTASHCYGVIFLKCECKGSTFLSTSQIFLNKIVSNSKKSTTFATAKQKEVLCCFFMRLHRDVAQLVAHYVRDVGVASSSPVIPTNKKEECFSEHSSFLLVSLCFDISWRIAVR